MTFPHELTGDGDAPGGGVLLHVDISPLTITPPGGALAATGADVPLLLIVAAVALIAVGAVVVVRRSRRRD
jgi:LPXTG-motif cell wall-anchored protein